MLACSRSPLSVAPKSQGLGTQHFLRARVASLGHRFREQIGVKAPLTGRLIQSLGHSLSLSGLGRVQAL